jgi:uncharacterized protein YkwD
MRKPLVGVCLTASAVLLAGGIAAATTAGAETTADGPAVVVPELSESPDLSAVPPLPVATTGHPAPAGAAAATATTSPGADAPPATSRPAATPEPDRDRPSSAAAEPAPQQPQPQKTEPQQPRPQKTADPGAGAHRDVTPGSISGSETAPVQRQVLALVNEHRARGGCDGLTPDRRLIAAANRHAAEMARNGYFAHRSLDGRGTAERVSDAGYRWSRYGENIARGQDSPDEVVDGWMNSPEHRENILDCRFEQMGIGLAFAGDTPYWVQDFATPQ